MFYINNEKGTLICFKTDLMSSLWKQNSS